MSNLKRFLAMTLVMVMMIGSLAMTASAKPFDDVDALEDPDLIAAVDLLSEFGIAKGTTEDTFDPESAVTRQQFALFVGRIHTATPEYFLPSDSKDDVPPFADVVDKTYFTAINYCYENQIINGVVAPTDEEDGEFNPNGEIIFQDAVKMLVSALGYAKTGLSYPVGYLAKAKEIGLLEGFGLEKMKAGETVTRADMAGLLYNYFLSDYIEVQMVWNPVQNQYVANQIKTPVCNKFGITKIEGYVTAIEGAAIPLWVEDTLDLTSATPIQLVAPAISMKTANPDTAGHYNLTISYLTNEFEKVNVKNYIPVMSAIDPTTGKPVSTAVEIGWIEVSGTTTEQRKVANFNTTKAALGLDKDYADLLGSRELLGVKVVAFVNTTNKVLPLPKTRVVGKKTMDAKASVDAGWQDSDTRINNGNITSLTVEDAEGTKVVFNHRAPTDFVAENMYAFASDGKPFANPIAPLANTFSPDVNNLNYLLGTVARSGQYTIDYVDNGPNSDGTRNHFIIFTPYEAIYITSHGDDLWKNVTGNGQVGDAISRKSAYNKVIDSLTFKSRSWGDDENKAYLISRQGEYVLRHGEELVKLGDNATVTNINNDQNTVRFQRSVATVSSAELSINYNSRDVLYKVLKNRTKAAATGVTGAFTTAATGSTNAYAMSLGQKYHVYAVASKNPNYGYAGGDSGEFFVWKTGNAPTLDTAKHYAYVVSTNNAGQTLANGTRVVIYQVYDFDTRTLKEIRDVQNIVSPYNRGAYIVYYYQGIATDAMATHRITGAVDPYTLLSTTNTKDITGARADLRAVLAAFGTFTDVSEEIGNRKAFNASTEIGKAFAAQVTKFATALNVGTLAIGGLGDIFAAADADKIPAFGNLINNGSSNQLSDPNDKINVGVSEANIANAIATSKAAGGKIKAAVDAIVAEDNSRNYLFPVEIDAIATEMGALGGGTTGVTTTEIEDAVKKAIYATEGRIATIEAAIRDGINAASNAAAQKAADAKLKDPAAMGIFRTDKLTNKVTNLAEANNPALQKEYTKSKDANVNGTVGGAANTFYNTRTITTLTFLNAVYQNNFIDNILDTRTNAVSAVINTERAAFYADVTAMNNELAKMALDLAALQKAAAAIPAADAKSDARVVAFAEAYYAAVKALVDYINADLVPAVQAVFDRLTNSNSLGVALTSTGTANLAGTAFLDTNEAGWLTTDNQFTFNVNSLSAAVASGTTQAAIDARKTAFNGFYYNPQTSQAYVGRPNADLLTDTANFVTGTIQQNTQIVIYGIKSQSIYNIISRDQLNAFIYELAARTPADQELHNVIRSALLVRDNANLANGTAKLLILGLDEDDDYANDLLNTKNYAGEELLVTTVKNQVSTTDGTNYYLIDAFDLVTRTTTSNLIVSAVDPLYGPQSNGTFLQGRTVYLTSTYVTIAGTSYRVAQILQSVDSDNQNILTYSFLSSMVANTNQYATRIWNYLPSVGVTTINGVSYTANASNVAFINVTLNTTTGTFTINSADYNLKTKDLDSAINGFSVKSNTWGGFNIIRSSEWNSIDTTSLTNYPINSTTLGTGTWYVVPAQYSSTGSVTLIYVTK